MIAQAAAERAKMHEASKAEQQRQHKVKQDAILEEDLLDLCIRESLAEKERLAESSALSGKAVGTANEDQGNKNTVVKPSAPLLQQETKIQTKKLMARFVKDVTMPDGSEIAPCSTFFKTWRVRNDGEVDWPEGCHLVSAGGDRMVDPKLGDDYNFRQEVPVVVAGSEVDLTVELWAPSATGRHVSYFRLENPGGSYFGQRLWSDIRVNEADLSVSMTLAPWEVVGQNDLNSEGKDHEEVTTEFPNEQEDITEVKQEGDKNKESEAKDSVTVDVLEKILDDTPIMEEVSPNPSSVMSSQSEDEFDAEVARWSSELQVLSAMGFNDIDKLLPVLKAHIEVPSSEKGDNVNTSRSEEGLQSVVLALLSREE